MGKLTDVLRLLASRDNMSVLSALASGPSYPRVLAKRLGRSETHTAHRLRALEGAGLVEGNWSRDDGRNVRLYRLKHHRLELLIGEGGWQVGPVDSESAPPKVRPSGVPSRTTLYGRMAELQALSSPRIRFVMVVGLPGIGKTSLAAELAHRYGTDRVFWHSFTPPDTASAFLEAAAAWCAGDGQPRGVPEPTRKLQRVTRDLDRKRALVVLDNYHNVRDEGIHEIVRSWQRSRKAGLIMVLSRTRPPIDRTPTTEVLPLSGLSHEASVAVLRSRGIKMSANDGRRLWRTCRGHPLALMLAGPHLRPADRLSQNVLEQLGRHATRALDESSRDVLISLAAVRRPMDVSSLRFISGRDDLSLPLILLERRGFVRPAGPLYEAHDVLREALAPITAARPDVHRRASAMLRASDRPEDALEAIYHALKAGDAGDAMELLEAEVVHDRHRLVHQVSVGSYLEVLEEVPLAQLPSRSRFLVHLQRGALLYEVAKTAAAIREYERALRIAESAGEPLLLAVVLAPLGDLLPYAGRMAEAERLLLRNVRVTQSEGWTDRRARGLFLLNQFYARKGDLARSQVYGELALRAALQLGDRLLAVDIETCPTPWGFYRPGAERRIRREMAWVRRQKDPMLLDYCRVYFGERLCRGARAMRTGRVAAARRALGYLDPVVANCDTLRMVWTTTYVRSWCAEALRLAGDMERAESEAMRVLATERDFGVNHCLILGHDVLAHVCASRADMAAARTHAERALRVAEQQGCGCVGVARAELAFQEAASGAVVKACALWSQALDELGQRGYPDELEYALREGERRGLARTERRRRRLKTGELSTPTHGPSEQEEAAGGN